MNEYRIGMYILITLFLCGVFGVLPLCVACLTHQPEQNCYLNLDDVSSETTTVSSETTVSTQRIPFVQHEFPV